MDAILIIAGTMYLGLACIVAWMLRRQRKHGSSIRVLRDATNMQWERIEKLEEPKP